jgi:uncharacterized membrane protein (DUF373 family)
LGYDSLKKQPGRSDAERTPFQGTVRLDDQDRIQCADRRPDAQYHHRNRPYAAGDLSRDFLRIISDVLTLFILIELSRSLVEYFSTARLRMTFIVDAAIVFVLRELMIQLFEHKITPPEIYATSVLLLVMTVLRIGSVVVYQRGVQMDRMAGVVPGKEE